MKVAPIISENIKNIEQLCKDNSVHRLFVFGSAALGNWDSSKSDVDVLVEVEEADPLKKGEKLLNFWNELERLLHVKIDLLTPTSVKNPYLKESIELSKVLLYES